jgi:YVTN family beta-propeller protein
MDAAVLVLAAAARRAPDDATSIALDTLAGQTTSEPVSSARRGVAHPATAVGRASSAAASASPTYITSVSITGYPPSVAVSPDGTRVYVTSVSAYGKGLVSVIDATASTPAVIATVAVVLTPYSVAVSPDGTRVYVASTGSGDGNGTVSVIDATASTPKVIATVVVGGYAKALAVSPDGTRVYTVDEEHNVSVIDTTTSTPKVIATAAIGGIMSGVAVSPDGTRLYTADNGEGTVSVINVATATPTLIATVKVDTGGPWGIAVSPDGTRVYTTNSRTVSVIDTTTSTPQVIATVAVGDDVEGLAVSPDGTRVYVTGADHISGSSVWVIDTGTPTPSVISTVGVDMGPRGIAVSPDSTRIYTANYSANTVSVIDTGTSNAGGGSGNGAGSTGPWSTVANTLNGVVQRLTSRVQNSAQNPVDKFFLDPETGAFATIASLGEDALSVIGPVGKGAAQFVARLNPLVSLGLAADEIGTGAGEAQSGHYSSALMDFTAAGLSAATVALEATPGLEELAPVAATGAAIVEGVKFLGQSFFHW